MVTLRKSYILIDLYSNIQLINLICNVEDLSIGDAFCDISIEELGKCQNKDIIKKLQ